MNDMDIVTKNIFKDNLYCVLATVCEDGAPWGVPVHFAYDPSHIYWLSKDHAIHSQNIARDGRIFITIFDSRQPDTFESRSAIYIPTIATRLSGDAASKARDIYADRFLDENGRKLAEWNVYSAPIGEIDQEKSVGQMVYYRQPQGTSA